VHTPFPNADVILQMANTRTVQMAINRTSDGH